MCPVPITLPPPQPLWKLSKLQNWVKDKDKGSGLVRSVSKGTALGRELSGHEYEGGCHLRCGVRATSQDH